MWKFYTEDQRWVTSIQEITTWVVFGEWGEHHHEMCSGAFTRLYLGCCWTETLLVSGHCSVSVLYMVPCSYWPLSCGVLTALWCVTSAKIEYFSTIACSFTMEWLRYWNEVAQSKEQPQRWSPSINFPWEGEGRSIPYSPLTSAYAWYSPGVCNPPPLNKSSYAYITH